MAIGGRGQRDRRIRGQMAHDHHHHGCPATGRRLGISVALTLAFVLGEAAVGYWSRSLALVSDAGHNLADALALIFSWWALRVARWPAHSRLTFGYHRAGIFAALVNALSLVAIAVFIFWEAIQRLRHPMPVEGGPMIVVALVAVVLNTVISLWLRGEARDDLNIRSAYLHMLGDAIAALGVVVAGIVVTVTGDPIADPIVSILIGLLILASSWGILNESVNVLLEGVPKGLDMAALGREIAAVPGVLGTHDLHVWTVGSGIVACSCHIVVSEQSVSSSQQVLRAVAIVLRQRFRVAHTTIQVEVEGCDPDTLYCTLHPTQGPHSHHAH
jgi:cobalt-zinc-cadmium efflux system protein